MLVFIFFFILMDPPPLPKKKNKIHPLVKIIALNTGKALTGNRQAGSIWNGCPNVSADTHTFGLWSF